MNARERAQGLVEYAFILLLVAVLAIAALQTIAPPIVSQMSNVSAAF